MRKLLVVMLMVAVAVSASAQVEVKVGPRGGFNISKIKTSGFDDEKFSLGAHVGGVVNIAINEMFSVQPELLFSQKGVRITGTGDAKSVTRINYIAIPLLGKATFGGDDFGGYAEFGPEIGIAVSGKDVDVDVDGNKTKESLDFGGDGEAKRADFALNFGAGFSKALGNGQLDVGVRFGVGVIDVIDGSAKTRTRNIQFTVAYLIPIGG